MQSSTSCRVTMSDEILNALLFYRALPQRRCKTTGALQQRLTSNFCCSPTHERMLLGQNGYRDCGCMHAYMYVYRHAHIRYHFCGTGLVSCIIWTLVHGKAGSKLNVYDTVPRKHYLVLLVYSHALHGAFYCSSVMRCMERSTTALAHKHGRNYVHSALIV